MPWLAEVLASGRRSSWEGHCAMPALTNPNKVSIATGTRQRLYDSTLTCDVDPSWSQRFVGHLETGTASISGS